MLPGVIAGCFLQAVCRSFAYLTFPGILAVFTQFPLFEEKKTRNRRTDGQTERASKDDIVKLSRQTNGHEMRGPRVQGCLAV